MYRGYTEKMVRKWGVLDPDEAEDIASAILIKFLERDMLNEFDPTRNVLFSTYLGGFISAYVRYMKDKTQQDRWREGTSHDVVIAGADNTATTIYDIVAPKHYDDHSQIEYLDFIKRVRAHLAKVPPLPKNDKLDPVAFFDQIVLHEFEYGRIHVTEMCKHFGASVNTVKSWIKRVQHQVAIVEAL